jgi:nucleoside-diphosphate-sugar epimerase
MKSDLKRKIVVTGAAGFLGGRTAKFFASHFTNDQIIATSRRKVRENELNTSLCKFIAGDLCNVDFCESITQDAEIVIHCAALSAPFGYYESFYQSNFIATKNILESSIKNGVKRFVYISTPSIYFNYLDRFNVSEKEPLPKKMVNHYAQTKLLAEKLVLQYNNNGIETIALRPRAIIGAEDTVIFPRVLEAYYKRKLKIIGDGKNICDFTCVRNVIESIICAINAPKNAYGEAYNITDGKSYKFWDVLNYALTTLGEVPPTKRVPKFIALVAAGLLEFKAKILDEKKEPLLTKYGVGILANDFTLDITKAKILLNYKPVMETFEGINEYILWHKSQH